MNFFDFRTKNNNPKKEHSLRLKYIRKVVRDKSFQAQLESNIGLFDDEELDLILERINDAIPESNSPELREMRNSKAPKTAISKLVSSPGTGVLDLSGQDSEIIISDEDIKSWMNDNVPYCESIIHSMPTKKRRCLP